MDASISEMLLHGFQIMLMGMTIVYLFLALLVWVIGISARLIQHYSPAEPASFAPRATPSKGESDNEGELVAVIAAAIHQHQNK